MSPLDSILGLVDVEVIRAEQGNACHVLARPSSVRPVCLYCCSASLRIKLTEKRTLKHTRQGNRLL